MSENSFNIKKFNPVPLNESGASLDFKLIVLLVFLIVIVSVVSFISSIQLN